ncbi:inorganic diphosphatase [Hymenobacter cellulosilyticus]|uniref:inorganic diphosphatase n=1 Tax=Hymenobacter cellulosilyticus TaxID=2932248 RepID=A0A8T9Q5D2_9BACT|nr:inorganic diphosphatase [Hymenobacter cellulosilyticus]UOQ72172.1 inorganic diphosphatase [Hymenobacter cellulosilyticus]
MRFAFGIIIVGLGMVGLSSCQPNYAELPTFSPERKLLQVVVEVPAGSNHAQRYDTGKKDFVPVRRAGLDHVVEFLPCPGNQGFIPGTRLPSTSMPLQALILAETQPEGTVVEVLPIGLLTLDDNGVLEQVLIAVPARPSQQILPGITSWKALVKQFPSAKEAVGQWFQHQGRMGEIRLVGWKDEKAAEQQVRQAMK